MKRLLLALLLLPSLAFMLLALALPASAEYLPCKGLKQPECSEWVLNWIRERADQYYECVDHAVTWQGEAICVERFTHDLNDYMPEKSKLFE